MIFCKGYDTSWSPRPTEQQTHKHLKALHTPFDPPTLTSNVTPNPDNKQRAKERSLPSILETHHCRTARCESFTLVIHKPVAAPTRPRINSAPHLGPLEKLSVHATAPAGDVEFPSSYRKSFSSLPSNRRLSVLLR